MDWLSRLYVQRGRRYVLICGAIGAADLLLLLNPFTTVVTARYMGLSVKQGATTIGVAEPLLFLSIVIGAIVGRRELRIVGRWASGNRDGLTAADVADAAHTLPIRLFVGTAIPAFVIAFPAGVVTTLQQIDQLDVGNFVVVFIAGSVYSLWGIVLLWTWGDISMRPVLIDVQQADPARRARRSTWWTLRVKVTFVLGSAFLVGSCYGGALTSGPDTELDGLWKLTWITVVVSVGFGLVLVPLFSTMLLEPIRALSRATHAVSAKNLDVHVPVTTDDELGELATSFNDMMDGLRERAALRIDNATLVAELQASRHRIVAASDAARRHVERNLHDGAQQLLVTALLKAHLLADESDASERESLRADLQGDLELALRELRDLAHGVYPAQLDAEGLVGALSSMAARAPLPCSVTPTDITRYPLELEAAVYFSCMEALQNAVKHASATAVEITLHGSADGVTFAVADDGVGFDLESVPSRSGLQNIEDRVGALAGQASIISVDGQGTTVSGHIPCAASADQT